MFTGIYTVASDKRRRITLPKSLFNNISDNEEFVIVGKFDCCEIWRREDWKQKSDSPLQRFDDDEISLSDLIGYGGEQV